MQYVVSNWPSVCSSAPVGNRDAGCWRPGSMLGKEAAADRPAAGSWRKQISTMKNPRKQNGNAVGTVRTGISYPATDLGDSLDTLPRQPEQYISKAPSPQEFPLPEEESFRAFLNSRLPQFRAPQALRERIRSSIQQSEI